MYCHCSVPGTNTCKPPRRLCKNERLPKSVWAPIAASSSDIVLGAVFIHLASLPLYSSKVCRLASVPSGSPNLSFNVLMSVALISKDLRTNGAIVDSILAQVADGYSRRATFGHARASSLATLMNSTRSGWPVSSVAFAPACL